MVCFVILRSGDIVTVHHFSPNVQDCAGGLLWEGGGQQAGQSDHPEQEPHQVHPGTVGLIDGLLPHPGTGELIDCWVATTPSAPRYRRVD